MNRIVAFTDLVAWQKGHELTLAVYGVSKQFPKTEMFGLTSQIRRSAISVTSNIAEGFSRKSSREKIQFYYIALGSLTELQNQLILARDIGYLNSGEFLVINQKTDHTQRLIHGLIRFAKSTLQYS